MRVLALAGERVRGARSGRVLLAPLVALAVVQLIGLGGGVGPAALLLVTAVSFSLPVLAWTARQVLDAEPDEQVLLSLLAVGGRGREVLAGLLAAYAVTAPLALTCAAGSLLFVDPRGFGAGELLAGAALALATALAAVAIGVLASRAVAGTGGAAVVVLVAAPVLVAVLGLSDAPLVSALVPRLAPAVRAAYRGELVAAAPAVVAQVLAWSAVVLAVRLGVSRRG